MNQRQLASVLFGVGGILLVVSRLPEIVFHIVQVTQWDPEAFDQVSPISQRSFAIVALTGTLVAALMGLGVTILRERLAVRLFQLDTPSLSGPGIQAVAFSVLGCYFAINGLARVYQPGGLLHWASAVELALGVGLFFGSRGLSRVWAQLQSSGGTGGTSGGVV